MIFEIDINQKEKIKDELKNRFQMTNLRLTLYYLSIRIRRNKESKTIIFLQIIYLQKILKKYSLIVIFMNLSVLNSTLSLTKQTDKNVIY